MATKQLPYLLGRDCEIQATTVRFGNSTREVTMSFKNGKRKMENGKTEGNVALSLRETKQSREKRSKQDFCNEKS